MMPNPMKPIARSVIGNAPFSVGILVIDKLSTVYQKLDWVQSHVAEVSGYQHLRNAHRTAGLSSILLEKS
jgi:hypothetical protein